MNQNLSSVTWLTRGQWSLTSLERTSTLTRSDCNPTTTTTANNTNETVSLTLYGTGRVPHGSAVNVSRCQLMGRLWGLSSPCRLPVLLLIQFTPFPGGWYCSQGADIVPRGLILFPVLANISIVFKKEQLKCLTSILHPWRGVAWRGSSFYRDCDIAGPLATCRPTSLTTHSAMSSNFLSQLWKTD